VPNVNVPKLSQLPDGRFVTKWGGKRHYLGRNQTIAVKLYAESIAQWSAWRGEVDRVRSRPMKLRRRRLIDISVAFLESKSLEGGIDLERYYRKHTKRFVGSYGGDFADGIRVGDLTGLKNDMLRKAFAPKTVNHDVIAVRAMMQYAIDQELIPPVNLKGCKPITLGLPPDKSMTIDKVMRMFADAGDKVRPWLVVNYLTAARPIEVVRIVHKQGTWIEPGIFRLDRGKNDARNRVPRHLILTPEALSWLHVCRPYWSRLDSFSAAVRNACGAGGPHPLRHTAASHLHRSGVDRADIDLILGHLPGRVSLTYVQIAWQRLRCLAARIGLRTCHEKSLAS